MLDRANASPTTRVSLPGAEVLRQPCGKSGSAGGKVTASPSLAAALGGIGYGAEFRQDDISAPVSGVVVDVVAFTHLAPQDLRTSAISGFAAPKRSVGEYLEAARLLATPFALIESPSGGLDLYRVAADERSTELVRRISSDQIPALRGSDLAAALAPRAIRAAKAGIRQLALFPIDARLLLTARDRSIGSIRTRLERSLARVLEEDVEPTKAARLVIASLAAVIVRDKYRLGDVAPSNLVDAVLVRHGGYFSGLAAWQLEAPTLLETVLGELGEDVDYSAIDARSINSVYEQFFLTRELQREFGIFHTDLRFASRILDYLPVEEIPPDERYVVDPACGSGNLLLAAQERLENLSPGQWSPEDTHRWLKTHIYGSDIEPIAVEIAKLSLLVSSLPLGNSWQIEHRDALIGAAHLPVPPTIWVTNPPWRNPKGAQAEAATRFLAKAVATLADGGLLACILPASWLSARQHRDSRREVVSRCSLFEVWRLPRDMFAPNARFPAAVVFAQKAVTASRSSFAFRWLTAGSQHREDFLDRGAVQFQSANHLTDNADLVDGPADRLATSGFAVGQVARLRAGIAQSGTPTPASSGRGVPFLARGASVASYRMIDPKSITWVTDPSENFPASRERVLDLLTAPKLLVQADRFTDNSWRLRTAVDSLGAVPGNLWHAIIGEERTVLALNALFSSSIASCFVQSRSTTKRITLDVLRQIPLPRDWRARYERDFAELGSQMTDSVSDLPVLIDAAESLARRAFGIDSETARAIDRVMAGFRAPDGRVRIHEAQSPLGADATRPDDFNQAPGTVLEVKHTSVRIWINGGPDEGLIVGLPEEMPGWLLKEGTTFELTGQPQTGQYRFHRTAHVPDEEILGINGEFSI